MYTLGIQTNWQLKVMAKFGDYNGLSFDATLGTNTPQVRHEVNTAITSSCLPKPEAFCTFCTFCTFSTL
jgi:hypothetical protein